MTQIYRYLFLFTLLLHSLPTKAQFDNEKYDKEYFLIGILNEYMGYPRTFTKRDDFYYQRVGIMSKDNLKLALFIDSMFNLDYTDITIIDNGASQGIIYSPTLSQKIDEYYNYEPSRLYTISGDTVYRGNLKKEKFTTEKQKFSFLLGAYLIYGGDKVRTNSFIQLLKKEKLFNKEKGYENVSYGLFMPNAQTKAKICVEFLKDLACKDVEYVSRKSIPAGNFVIFVPYNKILEVINEAERLEKYIEKIDIHHVEFTPDGTKFIWEEPVEPAFQKK